MASDLTVGLDMIAAATVPTKPSARLLWGVVTSATTPVQVVLENDASATSRPVSGNAAGPVVVRDRVLLARQRRRLTIVANPTAQARLTAQVATLTADTDWATIPLSLSGVTGDGLAIRRVGGKYVELSGRVMHAAFPTGSYQVLATLAPEWRPSVVRRFLSNGNNGRAAAIEINPDGRLRYYTDQSLTWIGMDVMHWLLG